MTMLLAPIFFMNHAGSILSTLMGVDGGWRPQVRDRNGFAWSDLVRHYVQHMIFGFCLLLASFAISPSFMLQNLPMATVLIFAPLIARQVSGVARKGSVSWLLYATPEDLKQPEIVRRAEQLAARGTTDVRRLAPAAPQPADASHEHGGAPGNAAGAQGRPDRPPRRRVGDAPC